MVKLKCYHCQSENLVRNGKTNNGKQRYLCNDCGRMSRDNPQSNGYSAEEREQIRRVYQERSSLRGLTRTFGVARAHRQQLAQGKNSCCRNQRKRLFYGMGNRFWNSMNDGHLFSRKLTNALIWIALCRQTRQVVAARHRRPVEGNLSARCGRKFPKHCGKPIALPTFGKPLNW